MLRIALIPCHQRVKCLHALHSLETQTETPYGTNSNEEKNLTSTSIMRRKILCVIVKIKNNVSLHYLP